MTDPKTEARMPRDLVTILRTEARNQRTPPIDYAIAEDGGRMVHRPEPDIAMAELLEEAATALAAKDAELAEANARAERQWGKWTFEARALYAHPPAQAGAVTEAVREALIFYENHGAGCRLIHSGGDASRNALAKDGGKRAENALAAITAALGAQTPPEGAVTEAQGWRAIETAPKEGTVIIAVCSDAQRPRAHATWWHDGWWRSYEPKLDKFETENPFRWFPTHWMPLPTPPVNQSEGADRG